jgi:hypothetical protein
VFATLAAFAFFVIRAATVASRDSADDSPITEFQAIRILDSMSRS